MWRLRRMYLVDSKGDLDALTLVAFVCYTRVRLEIYGHEHETRSSWTVGGRAC